MPERTPQCLDEVSIAALVDGRQFKERPTAIAHVGECPFCRHQLAAIVRATTDPSVTREIDAVEHARNSIDSSRRGWRTFAVAGVAAAAVAVVMLRPVRDLTFPSAAESPRRESAITATGAPQIVSPSGPTARTEAALRWTGVKEADVYRVRIWDTSGDVIWSIETRDTVAALPSIIRPRITYLWEVTARTGWNRWTSSEFVEFTIADSKQ